MAKDSINDYEKGYRDGKEGNYYSDLNRANSWWSSSDHQDSEQQAYNDGYADGLRTRNRWDSESSKQEGCFITTAWVKYNNKTDSCNELQLLRQYRDNYVRNLPNGDFFINAYYHKSPLIVRHIENLQPELQEEIFEILSLKIEKACQLIRDGELQKAFELYFNTILELDKRFFP